MAPAAEVRASEHAAPPAKRARMSALLRLCGIAASAPEAAGAAASADGSGEVACAAGAGAGGLGVAAAGAGDSAVVVDLVADDDDEAPAGGAADASSADEPASVEACRRLAEEVLQRVELQQDLLRLAADRERLQEELRSTEKEAAVLELKLEARKLLTLARDRLDGALSESRLGWQADS
eukprot:TRINITY_DN69537_c0_g1_i1.p2 TRINITY_DN69537_c0_g1~~TRINITY_DN69537_c0_g1_i1.p2  ORF type:complete len:180 (+),score=66.07 TRINITY_DN69537_c0_g1_i1:104-643(+)